MTHIAAMALIKAALPHATVPERLALQGVAWIETNYGTGWKGDGEDSHNWGAITIEKANDGTCGPKDRAFLHADSRYDSATGKVIKYKTCFRKYNDDTAGIKHLYKIMMRTNVRDAANSRNLLGVAAAMRNNNYYKGIKPKEESIQIYYRALKRAIEHITEDTGVENPFLVLAESDGSAGSQSGESQHTSSLAPLEALLNVKYGEIGSQVVLLQSMIGQLKTDGMYGPLTHARLHALLQSWLQGNS